MKPTAWPDFEDVRGARLLVALSGGADSTALLAMLVGARKRLELHLAAAHVNHSIRGSESRADAEFCEKLCRELNVDFYLKNVDAPAAADASHEGIETVARRLRYDALREVRAQTRSDWIVLAHHRDDQAETVLMHLLRGCGGRGIGGMDKFSGDLYRPLLNVSKAELESFLLERGMRWREDSTNAVPDTPRNALRLNVLPLLEQSYPQAARAVARYAQIARREDRLLDEMTDAFLQDRLERVPCGLRLNRPEETDEAILHRALQKLLGENASFDKIDELAQLCRVSRGKTGLSNERFAERTPSALYFLPKRINLPAAAALPENGSVSLGTLGVMRASPSEPVPIRGCPTAQVLRKDALTGASLRVRRSGDRMRPMGGGDRLLSDVLTDRKIDRPLRDFVPLVARENRVLWAVGVGIAEEAKLRPGDAAVKLEWFPD